MQTISDPSIDAQYLKQIRAYGGTWAAYQNVDLSSADIGHIQLIKYGQGCTFERPPEKRPDTPNGLGWRYAHVGYVDLTAGLIVEVEPHSG